LLAQTVIDATPATGMIETFFSRWCEQLDKPLVLLLDEVDALVGDTLISLLRQLRAGYPNRPAQFPQTVILCGVRDIRDYRMESAAGRVSNVVYNINSTSIRLGDFSQEELYSVLEQHTMETGQAFEPEAIELLWRLTQGQPWLVNALAAQASSDSPGSDKPTLTVTADAVLRAKECLVAGHSTHLERLRAALSAPDVRQVIEAVLANVMLPASVGYQTIADMRDEGLLSASGILKIRTPSTRK
jgi:Cdc6-like AAA superfamily ATPase